jgi:hypothetical protein
MPQSGCRTPGISAAEAAAARAGNRKAFWAARAADGDPIGATGLSIVNDTGLGWVANGRLQSAISDAHSDWSAASVRYEANKIGVQIMQAHVAAVGSSGGNLSAGDIARYHFRIFEANGLPASTFGGAALTGTEAEAGIYSGVWRHCP